MYIKTVRLKLQNPKLKAEKLTLNMIKEIVRLDSKQRYDLILEDAEGSKVAIDLNANSSDPIHTLWWIKACQGHSLKVRSLIISTIDCLYLATDSPTRFETYNLH